MSTVDQPRLPFGDIWLIAAAGPMFIVHGGPSKIGGHLGNVSSGLTDARVLDVLCARKLVATVTHWHHRFEIWPGVVTQGSYDPTWLWNALCLPADLHGQRILEIGPSDGFFSLNLQQRGADIVAVDYRAKEGHGFAVMEQISGISFDYRHMNLYDLDPVSLGKFDRVLFLGVLYHLPDMMRALVTLRRLCMGIMHLETHYDDFSPEMPAARYHKWTSLGGDYTNFWAPNRLCVLDMLYDAGFDITRDESHGSRLVVECAVNDDPERRVKTEVAYSTLG